MEASSRELDFEPADLYRDPIASMRRVQERQYIRGEHGGLDIVAGIVKAGSACVQVFFIRDGRNLSNKIFFPTVPDGTVLEDVLSD